MTEKLYDYEPVAKDIPVGELKTSPTNDIFRYIEKQEYDYLKKSVSKNIKTGYFKARPCLVSDRTGEYVIFGGNQRYKAAKELGYAEIPCYVFSGLTEADEIELMMTDNGHFAKFNHQELANFFESGMLIEWGIPAPVVFSDAEVDIDSFFEQVDDIKEEDSKKNKIVFEYPKEMFDKVKQAIADIDSNNEKALLKLLGL